MSICVLAMCLCEPLITIWNSFEIDAAHLTKNCDFSQQNVGYTLVVSSVRLEVIDYEPALSRQV